MDARQTPAIVKYYEEYTAQPYPFDKLDLLGAPDFRPARWRTRA